MHPTPRGRHYWRKVGAPHLDEAKRAVYRAEIARVVPLAGDGAAYRAELAHAAAIWLFGCLSWHLDAALKDDSTWGIWSIRGRLLWYLQAVIERGEISVPVQKLGRPFATLTLPMADQGHSLGGTGNRLFGVTSALGWLGRGLAGVRTLGVQSDLPSLNEGCANVAAICQKLSEPNATPRKRGFSFIRIARLMDKPSMRSFQGGGRG
jgi:hypothetical protein